MSEPVQVRVGDEARTASVLRPGGIVVIAGQRYSARSGGELIEEGALVVITGGDNHGFTIEQAEHVSQRELLPNFGQAVYADFGSSKRAQAIEEEERARRWLAARKRWIRRVGPMTGGIFAALGIGLLWQDAFAPLAAPDAGLLVAAIVAGGALAGFLLIRLIDGFLRDVDFVLYRFSWPSVALVLTGFVAGVVLTLPQYGTAWGLIWGAVGALLLGLPLPILASVIAVGGPSDAGAAADAARGQAE